jgi:thioredoxin reductase
MTLEAENSLDVAVIGGGPAGISACLELSKLSKLKIALFECDDKLGGIPRIEDIRFFGFRDLKRVYSGPKYAKKLDHLIRNTSVEINTEAMVLKIMPKNSGEMHQLEVLSPQGAKIYNSRFIILATGCFESSQFPRVLPGLRPAGVFTTGTLLELADVQNRKPGKSALIMGSEHVVYPCILTLRKLGSSIVGIVEEDPNVQTYSFPFRSLTSFYGIPIYNNTLINRILGDRRVEGVELLNLDNERVSRVTCDTVVITGKFRSYSPLIDHSSIERDPLTFGPVVDNNLMTSVPNIYAAGNVLRGADMHDLCSLEGKQAALSILEKMESGKNEIHEYVCMHTEDPIRYVVPQKIIPRQTKSYRCAWLHPGVSIQVSHTLKKASIEAWSNDRKIWESKPFKLIANNRISIPIKKFDWNQVDMDRGITLKIQIVRS